MNALQIAPTLLLALGAVPLSNAHPTAPRPALILDPADRTVFHHQPGLPATPPDAAGRPSNNFDALHYDITLSVDPTAENIEGTTTLRVECLADTDTLTVDLVGLEVSRFTVDGATATFAQSATGVSIEGSFEVGEVMDLGISYGGTPELLDDSLGFHFSEGVAFTFTEPDGSKYWFPCFDDPADKATLRLAITAPADLQVAGNGLMTAETLIEGGLKQTVWEHDHPIAPYLVAVAVADYEILDEEVDGLPIVHWVYPDWSAEAAADFAVHRDMIPMYEDIFSIDYPFEKYGAVMVPMGGAAMEHQTCTAVNDILVDGYGTYGLVLAHELAHHWWGDLVTCATWDDIWLNEGFATYSEALAVEHYYGEAEYTQYIQGMTDTYLAWSEYEGIFPLSDPDYMWGGTVYEKGGVVVHMLRMRMGDAAFFEALWDYGDRYAYSSATTDDLQAVFQDHTSVDLELFFDQWVHQAGHPELALGVRSTELLDGTYQIDVGVEQRQPWGLWEVALPIQFHGEEAPIDLALTEPHQVFSFCRDEAVTSYDIDPGFEVLKDLNIIPIGNWEFTEECGPTAGDDDENAAGGDGDDDDSDPVVTDDDCSCSAAGGVSGTALAAMLLAAVSLVSRRK